jgi:hypothetical protein
MNYAENIFSNPQVRQKIFSFPAIILFSMAISYPSKQTVFIAFVCIIAISITVYFSKTESRQNFQDITATTTEIISSQSDTISSSTDWKKQFFDTSTNTSLIKTNSSSTTATDTSLTVTDKLSRELFARFIQLKQNNLDGNQQLMQDAVDQTISNSVNSASLAKQYSITDLKNIISNNVQSSRYKNYGNTVANILVTYTPKDNAPTIAENAFEAGDMSQLIQIDPLINSYKIMIQKLLAVSVPKNISNFHIDLVNSISSILFVSEQLRNVQGDPMQSVVSLSEYTSAQDMMRTALLNIKNYFNNSGITFSATEPGNLFSTITP